MVIGDWSSLHDIPNPIPLAPVGATLLHFSEHFEIDLLSAKSCIEVAVEVKPELSSLKQHFPGTTSSIWWSLPLNAAWLLGMPPMQAPPNSAEVETVSIKLMKHLLTFESNKSVRLCFVYLQNLKNQIMTTNVWVEQVSYSFISYTYYKTENSTQAEIVGHILYGVCSTVIWLSRNMNLPFACFADVECKIICASQFRRARIMPNF